DDVLAGERIEEGHRHAQAAVLGHDLYLDAIAGVGAAERCELLGGELEVRRAGRSQPEPLEELADRRAPAARIRQRGEAEALLRHQREQRLEAGRRAWVLDDPPAGGLAQEPAEAVAPAGSGDVRLLQLLNGFSGERARAAEVVVCDA